MHERKLNDHGLHELDRDLDRHIATANLLQEERLVAISHVLHSFEDEISSLPSGDARSEGIGSKLIDGLHFAVLWCFKHCPSANERPELSFKPTIARAGRDLLQMASQYNDVCDLMSMMHRELGAGVVDSNGIIHVSVGRPDALLVLMAGRLTMRTAAPEARADIERAANCFSRERFREAADVRRDGRRAIKYHVNRRLFDEVSVCQRAILAHSWDLDETWDLGGYTVRQFRDFWVALTSLAWIHSEACSATGSNADVRDSVLLFKTRDRWASDISKYAGLNGAVAEGILKDLTFDPSLYGAGKPEPSLQCQPFIPLSANLLIVSGWLVRLTSPEAVLWHLLSIIRPTLHGELRNRKETFWRNGLIPKLRDHGLHASGPYGFHCGSEGSDLDLLIVDEARSFAIATELKWFKPAEDVKDSQRDEKEISKGTQQAALALKWLQSAPDDLANRSGLAKDTLSRLDYRAMVLSKNTLGTGSSIAGVPVVNEPLLDCTLGHPHRKSLEALYRVAEDRRYLPQLGVHFIARNIVSSFGGVRFIGTDFGAEFLRPWDPSIDLNSEGLN